MNNALLLADWTVTSIDQQPKLIRFHASYDIDPDHCLHCGTVGKPLGHGPLMLTFADTAFAGRPAEIVARVRRYRCRHCGKTMQQPLPDMATEHRMTRRLMDVLAREGLQETFARIGRRYNLDEKTVRQIVGVSAKVKVAERELRAPVILGIDELTLLGQRRSIFTDVGERRILDLVPDMDKRTVANWIQRLPDKRRTQVVTIDMWPAYRDVARKLLPDAKVVVDRFHIQKKASEALDKVRNRLASGKRGKARREALRGRRLLLARPARLSPRAAFVLQGWLANNDTLRAAWEAKESFYDIWEAVDAIQATWRFRLWEKRIPELVKVEFAPVAKTVHAWKKEIFAYFDHRFTNAYTEAANGIIKIANRAGRGYSFDNIRSRALLYEPVTSIRWWVCESCLGQFSSDGSEYVDTSHFVVPKPAKPLYNDVRICADCHSRIHILDGFTHQASPTA